MGRVDRGAEGQCLEEADEGAVSAGCVWRRICIWGYSREVILYFKGRQESLHVRETEVGVGVELGQREWRSSGCQEINMVYLRVGQGST